MNKKKAKKLINKSFIWRNHGVFQFIDYKEKCLVLDKTGPNDCNYFDISTIDIYFKNGTWELIDNVDLHKTSIVYKEVLKSPSHYKGKIQPIDLIESLGYLKPFCIANILKYASRYDKKGGIKDLEKAKWYLTKLIDYEKNA